MEYTTEQCQRYDLYAEAKAQLGPREFEEFMAGVGDPVPSVTCLCGGQITQRLIGALETRPVFNAFFGSAYLASMWQYEVKCSLCGDNFSPRPLSTMRPPEAL